MIFSDVYGVNEPNEGVQAALAWLEDKPTPSPFTPSSSSGSSSTLFRHSKQTTRPEPFLRSLSNDTREGEGGEVDEEEEEKTFTSAFHMQEGQGMWTNISPVIRATFVRMSKALSTETKQRKVLEARLAQIEAALEAKAEKENVQSLSHKFNSDFLQSLTQLRSRLHSMDQALQLKADATFVTNCLLTKANKSDMSSLELKFDQLRFHSPQVTSSHQQNDTPDVFRHVVEQELKEIRQKLHPAVDSLERHGVEIEKIQKEIKDTKERKEMEIQTTVQSITEQALKEQIRELTKTEIAKMVGARSALELNKTVQHVEKLAVVQANTQNILLSMERRFEDTATKADLERVADLKVSKASLQHTVHRMANRDEIAGTFDNLETRVAELERKAASNAYLLNESSSPLPPPPTAYNSSSSYQSSKKPIRKRNAVSKKKKSKRVSSKGTSSDDTESTFSRRKRTREWKREVSRLSTAVQKIQDSLAAVFATRDQVGHALDKLSEKVNCQIDQLRLQVGKRPASGVFGSHAGDAAEGRVDAVCNLVGEANSRSIRNAEELAAFKLRLQQIDSQVLTLQQDLQQLRQEQKHNAETVERKLAQPQDSAASSIKRRENIDHVDIQSEGSTSSTISPIPIAPTIPSIEQQRADILKLIQSLERNHGSEESKSSKKVKKRGKTTKGTKKKQALHQCTANEERRKIVKSKLEQQVTRLSKKHTPLSKKQQM